MRNLKLRRPLLAALLTLLLTWSVGCRNSGDTAPTSTPAPLSSTPQAQDTAEEVVLEGDGFRVLELTDGLEHPWGLAFLPDGSILITERPGRLRQFRDGQLSSVELSGVPEVQAQNQGGLLDIALHPEFEKSPWVYLSYSKPGEGGSTTAVVRGRLTDSGLEDTADIFVSEAWGNGGRHFGSRLLFDPEGYLFVTIGDRGQMDRAQDLSDHAGTTVRLFADGSVPQDNPFLEQPDVLPEIYSYGHRNAQGMAWHPYHHEIWQTEHGPQGGDELNRLETGANFGWPLTTHGIDYDGSIITDEAEAPGMVSPLLHWTPSIACSGLEIYSGDLFPQWSGSVFTGALKETHLRRVDFSDGEQLRQESMLDQLEERIRTVKQGPDGKLYLLTDHRNGRLLLLEPSS